MLCRNKILCEGGKIVGVIIRLLASQLELSLGLRPKFSPRIITSGFSCNQSDHT